MSTSMIPSFGALTPVESMLKGGKPSDLFNPTNIMGDTMTALQKPSSLLINPMKDKGKTMTAQQEEADLASAQQKARETNKWLNWTPSRNGTSTTSKTSKSGLSI
uniref:Uncharacterized protein n=1 Tax=Caudovirales sp. ctTqA28 TaxID=2826775 RepID=A0A8S5MEA8_9CAUD|nr:MAG TPA: hypothetical protein [Caudovirales sp. ctTqA28]